MENQTSAQIFSFPERGHTQRTGKQHASAVLQKQFRDGRGVDMEVFVHLARRVHFATDLLRQRYGERSGALRRAFGENFLKQKKRFSLAPEEKPRQICKNPGNWLFVLEGLAKELDEDRDEFILEAFTGSALLPGRTSTDHSKSAWFAAFLELMEEMTASLAGEADFASVCQYLFDSALMVEGDELIVTEHQGGAPFIDERLTYLPAVLTQLPYALGLNFQAHYSYPEVEIEAADLVTLLEQSGSTQELPSDYTYCVESGVRTGMAFTIDARTEKPALALFEWRVANLTVMDEEGKLVFSGKVSPEIDEKIAGDVISPLGRLMPGAIRFSFSGSAQFEAIATRHIVYPEIYSDEEANDMWDPGANVDRVSDYPTRSPGRTVAAAVERNLQYAASEGEIEKRLDTILRRQIRTLSDLISSHRSRHAATIEAARSSLLSEWRGK